MRRRIVPDSGNSGAIRPLTEANLASSPVKKHRQRVYGQPVLGSICEHDGRPTRSGTRLPPAANTQFLLFTIPGDRPCRRTAARGTHKCQMPRWFAKLIGLGGADAPPAYGRRRRHAVRVGKNEQANAAVAMIGTSFVICWDRLIGPLNSSRARQSLQTRCLIDVWHSSEGP
jgi:hypothetical protein